MARKQQTKRNPVARSLRALGRRIVRNKKLYTRKNNKA
jgi:hypothetical protein